jgi:ComEC/Rec2-related protein
MTGLALGLAFLSSFGLGIASVLIWWGIAILSRARQRVSTAAAAAIVMAAIAGAGWADANEPDLRAQLPSGSYEGISRLVEGPFLTQNGQRFAVLGDSNFDEKTCVFAGPSPRPHVGDVIFISGRVTLPQDLSDIGRAALEARDCSAQLRADTLVIVDPGSGIGARLSRFRTDLSVFLMQAAPGDTGALLSGLVTGEDGALSEEASDAFLSSGTTHITAISGANFTVLILLLGVMTTGAMRRSLWFIGAATSIIWLYAAMVGLQPSALRAALLATAVLLGRWLGRVPDLFTLTLLLASAQIVWRPQDFRTLAFQLSIAATVALIVVFDGSERVPGRTWPVTLLLTVVAAQLATLPILAARLGTVSATGLVANLAIGPMASIAFPISLAGGLVGQAAPWIGELVLVPAILVGDAMISVVTWIVAYLPGAVQLGEPVPGAIATLAVACWASIFALSGDLRRMSRHGWRVIRTW